MMTSTKSGMVEQWGQEHSIDNDASYVIGDRLCDIELGINCGVKTALIRTDGYALDEMIAREFFCHCSRP